jgi:uncharacterized protein involved in propanediol utilization
LSRNDVLVAGHFGEWLQGRLGPDGPVALVTLPCPALTVRAAKAAAKVGPGIFGAGQLRAFLDRLGLPGDPQPAIHCAMPPGAGSGASTAALVAIARWAGFDGAPDVLARACLAIEGATDPLMWQAPDRLLWASREARILRWMTAPPRCEILGGYWGPPMRTDPADTVFADISDLVETWADAVAKGDLVRAARVATLSSARCQRGTADPMADLARDLGALGHLRAHTGSARGLVFAPGSLPPHGRTALAEAGLTGVLSFQAGST